MVLADGFIKLNETLNAAAERILKERTGLDKEIYFCSSFTHSEILTL
jgi:ADP-ribose pyrophosphatase YjhB (NUDIX family)